MGVVSLGLWGVVEGPFVDRRELRPDGRSGFKNSMFKSLKKIEKVSE